MRFFHQIRRQFLIDRKFKKYLAYAVGEIILIVIGILIALAINNWNLGRIAAEKEQFYLAGLKDEFEQSKLKLETLIEVNRLNYEESKKLAGFVGNTNKPDEKELSKLLYNSFSFEINYNPNNSLLNEIINSGGLKNISNTELRKYLTNWESRIQGIHRQEQALREQREKVIDIFRNGTGSMRTVLELSGVSTTLMGLQESHSLSSNAALLQSREFENNLLTFILTGMSTETNHYQPLLSDIEIILQLIKSETK